MRTPTALLIAAAAALCLVAAALAAAAAPPSARRAGFFTLSAREEPTRPYSPYTGTPPVGPWGSRPWAEAEAPGRSECRRPPPPAWELSAGRYA